MINQKRLTSVIAAAAAIGTTSFAAGAEFVSPRAGGSGGDHSYDLDCGSDAVLTGLSGRWGSWMDSIGIICRKVNTDGTLGSSFTRGPKGGTGGTEGGNPGCEPGNVVQSVRASTGTYVNGITFFCGAWSPSNRTVARAPTAGGAVDIGIIGHASSQFGIQNSLLECPTDGKPAKAFRGKYGAFIDSTSLVCDSVAAGSAGSNTPTPGANAASPGASTSAAGAGLSAQTGAQLGSASAGVAASVITFDAAPAAGSAIALSASRGGDVPISASGGTSALSMSLGVADGTYRPFFELVSAPNPALPPVGGKTATSTQPQNASITRIVRLRAGAPRLPMTTTPVIPLIVTVRSADGSTAARTFLVTLLP